LKLGDKPATCCIRSTWIPDSFQASCFLMRPRFTCREKSVGTTYGYGTRVLTMEALRTSETSINSTRLNCATTRKTAIFILAAAKFASYSEVVHCVEVRMQITELNALLLQLF
jgi:hypothetical protein